MNKIQQKILNSLSSSAIDYFRSGMEKFHLINNDPESNFAVVIGNISISIELMLKTIICQKCFMYLYTNLPLNVELKLSYNQDDFNLKLSEEIDLIEFNYKTIEFDKSISIFYHLYPEKKQHYKPYFQYISKIRNVAVHSVLPANQRFNIFRVAFIAIELFKLVKEEKIGAFAYWQLGKADETFVANFDKIRIEKVKKAISQAKEKAKQITKRNSISSEDWELCIVTCPVCDSDAELYGYTDISGNYHYDYREGIQGDYQLEFFAESFNCESCGLKLIDETELEIAGVATYINRVHEIDAWVEDNKEHFSDYLYPDENPYHEYY